MFFVERDLLFELLVFIFENLNIFFVLGLLFVVFLHGGLHHFDVLFELFDRFLVLTGVDLGAGRFQILLVDVEELVVGES